MKSYRTSSKMCGSKTRSFFRATQMAWLTGIVVLTAVLPGKAHAHGELLIRIAEVTTRIEAATNNPQLYLERGELYREDKNWIAAQSDYNRAEQLDSKLIAVNFCRAKMLDDSGQWSSACILFDKVVSQSPQNGEALIGRARVFAKLNQSKLAIADFRKGLELLRDFKPEYFLEFAKVLAAGGNLNEALVALDRGINKFGPLEELQSYAVDLELKRNNSAAALVRIDTIIDGAVRKENWLAQRGQILLAAHRPKDAQKSFEDSLKAISVLPWRLQQGAAMVKLHREVLGSLECIANTPLIGKID